MKTLTAITATALFMTAAATSVTAEEANVTISFKDAIDISTEAAPGKLVSIALDDMEKGAHYIATLASDTSESFLVIDAKTGELVFQEIARASSPEALEEFTYPLSHEDMMDTLGLEPGDPVPWRMMLMLEELEQAHDDEDDLDDLEEICAGVAHDDAPAKKK